MDSQTGSEIELPPDLTILKLSKPYLDPTNSDDRNPTALTADLSHYRDLFSKLRFSYVEQATKERFLRGITAETPDFVDAAENTALQEQLAGEKAALKDRKREVSDVIHELEAQGRELARRHETLRLHTTTLATLPTSLATLEADITTLRANQPTSANPPSSTDPALHLPLQPTLTALQSREKELAQLDAQITALESAHPQKRARVEDLREEVGVLEGRKGVVVGEAVEARRREGVGREGRERGRWLRGVEGTLRAVVEG